MSRIKASISADSLKWRLAQALEIRWWKAYSKNKEPQAYLDWKKDYWQHFLARFGLQKSDLSGQKVLDAGCGPAGVFIHLDASASITALDPLIDHYESLSFFSREHYPHVGFEKRGIEELVQKESFDWIFCLNAINHVSDLDVSLANLYAALKPGGHLLLSIDVHKTSLLKWLFRLVPGDVLHPHQHSLSEYEEKLTKLGLDVKDMQCIKSGRIFDYYALLLAK